MYAVGCREKEQNCDEISVASEARLSIEERRESLPSRAFLRDREGESVNEVLRLFNENSAPRFGWVVLLEIH